MGAVRALAVGASIVALAACGAGSSSGPSGSQAAGSPAVAAPAATSPGAETVCSGPDVDWAGLPAVVQSYGRAWNEQDRAARLEHLEMSFADDGWYVDETIPGPVEGRAAFNDHIGGFQLAFRDHYFESTVWTDSDHHHDSYRMRWRLCDYAGNVVLVGEDVALVDDDGRFVQIVGWHE